MFGTRIATTLALPCRTTTDEPDLAVCIEDATPIGFEPAPGTVIADYIRGEVRWYSLSRQTDSTVLRLPGILDLSIANDHRIASFTPGPGIEHDLLSIMLAGTGVSTLLTLGGSTVLHGSGVVKDGRAIAFLGDSGQGKSTLTALCCLAGWSLLCDDVLRVEPQDPDRAERFVCFPGSNEIRLRDRAPYDPEWPSRTTFDDRRAVAPPSVDTVTPLDALVIPFPNREITAVEGRRLDPTEAIGRLVHFSRIGGWTDPDLLRATFSGSAAVARAIPVWEIQIPWEDRLVVDVANQLTDLVRNEVA